MLRERSHALQYFDALIAKFQSIQIAAGQPYCRNVFFHFSRVYGYTRSWFETQLQQGGLIFDGSSGLRDPTNLSPMAMVDEGQEALYVKNLKAEFSKKNDQDNLPFFLEGIFDDIMNDFSPEAGNYMV